MRRSRLAPLALAALLGGCFETSGPLLPVPEDGTILAFGDSITYGTGATRAESYPAVLGELSGRAVLNAGIPGEESAQGLERLKLLLDDNRPAVMVLIHGGNDILRSRSRADLALNLTEMVNLAKSKGIGVVLLAMPAPGLAIRPAELYKKVAAETQVPFDETTLTRILTDGRLKSDSVHPNAAGYAELARAVHRLLAANGALPGSES